MSQEYRPEDLIPPEMLKGLSEEERQEALAAAAYAKRAEERAEQRAIERALQRKEEERRREKEREMAAKQSDGNGRHHTTKAAPISSNGNGQNGGGVVFIPKRKRAQLEEQKGEEVAKKDSAVDTKVSNNNNHEPINNKQQRQKQKQLSQKEPPLAAKRVTVPPVNPSWSDREKEIIKETYLGKTAEELEQEMAEQRKKQKTNKKITFRFKWDETDDTFQEDDPLYASLKPRNPFAAQGQKKKRKTKKDALAALSTTTMDSVRDKPLDKMTARDWRIFRENYEITVKGGRAPPPMRSFREPPLPSSELPSLHPALLDSLENVMGFKEPTPIQRQAIPIGLQRRDLIGIAETGSGKTVAFGVPLCNYLINLPDKILNRVADEGPLAIIMAPTRELALQIDGELSKLLSRQKHIKNCAIIGGQQLQHQANALRQGVHIVIGTPGRINECLEMAYLVLNQCNFVVLDEADRMIDMGFAPQIESILDAMGGALKSENEEETYEQEKQDLLTNDLPRHRVTAMFSATMPMEVEHIAKRYLRHPAVISIGDQDSGKNARIVQKIVFLSSPGQKENALRDLLRRSYGRNEKIIVFVNEKKHADQVGRAVARMGRPCVVLHGGKGQDEREENLAQFRRGGVVLVATDVAGRGIDIPNVTHVVNYDLPTRSIENYTHRIGRTGRAGKEGLATSFITDEDEGIMAALKAYLESTGNPVPDRLARHPAAASSASNNLII